MSFEDQGGSGQLFEASVLWHFAWRNSSFIKLAKDSSDDDDFNDEYEAEGLLTHF